MPENVMFKGRIYSVFDREKVEQEIVPNTFGMIIPVHFIKELNGYRVYAGINIANETIFYITR